MKNKPKWERWSIRAKKFACYQVPYSHNALFSLYVSHEKRNGEAKRKCVLSVDSRRKQVQKVEVIKEVKGGMITAYLRYLPNVSIQMISAKCWVDKGEK